MANKAASPVFPRDAGIRAHSRTCITTSLLMLASALFTTTVAARADESRQILPDERLAHTLLRGAEPRWKAAKAAFHRAAAAGSPTAMAHLGRMHETGQGSAADAERAVYWYARAYEAGARHLAVKLGWMHLSGDAGIRDRAASETWFKRAVDDGDHSANVALASVLIADAQGGRDPQRVHEALDLLRAALDAELDVAAYFLARVYREGIGAQARDPAAALPYLRRGADQGHVQMQAWLAEAYAEDGANPVESAKWAMLAAIGGDPLGETLWQHHSSTLEPDALDEARRRALAWAEAAL